MIDVYFWPTGNGKKITIMLEECALPYRIIPVNINKGDHFQPQFSGDQSEQQDARGSSITTRRAARCLLFESGAILQYLAEKTGKLLPSRRSAVSTECSPWLYWQVGGLGPMAGQAHHFLRYAPQQVEYAMHRFRSEVARLYAVMNTQLGTWANIWRASIPSLTSLPGHGSSATTGRDRISPDFPNVKRWFEALDERPALRKGASVGGDLASFSQPMSDEDKKRLFNIREEDLKPAR